MLLIKTDGQPELTDLCQYDSTWVQFWIWIFLLIYFWSKCKKDRTHFPPCYAFRNSLFERRRFVVSSQPQPNIYTFTQNTETKQERKRKYFFLKLHFIIQRLNIKLKWAYIRGAGVYGRSQHQPNDLNQYSGIKLSVKNVIYAIYKNILKINWKENKKVCRIVCVCMWCHDVRGSNFCNKYLNLWNGTFLYSVFVLLPSPMQT